MLSGKVVVGLGVVLMCVAPVGRAVKWGVAWGIYLFRYWDHVGPMRERTCLVIVFFQGGNFLTNKNDVIV